jgi:hypothetical protein
MSAISGLLITIGWLVLWLVALGVAVAQVLRGRALAGALVGLAAVLGLLKLALHGLIGAGLGMVGAAAGATAQSFAGDLCYGLGDALLVLLIVVGAVVQRPPKAE